MKFTKASALDKFLSENSHDYNKISLLDFDMVNSYEEDELRKLSNSANNKITCRGIIAVSDDFFTINKNGLYRCDNNFCVFNNKRNLKDICDGFYGYKEQIDIKVKSAADIKKKNISYSEPDYNKIYKEYSKEYSVNDKEKFEEINFIINHINDFLKKQHSVCYIDSKLEDVKNDLKDFLKKYNNKNFERGV